MCDIPDHPDIRWAERTGYPRGQQEGKEVHSHWQVGRCVGCREAVWDDEERLNTPDGWVHDDYECLKEYISNLNNGMFS